MPQTRFTSPFSHTTKHSKGAHVSWLSLSCQMDDHQAETGNQRRDNQHILQWRDVSGNAGTTASGNVTTCRQERQGVIEKDINRLFLCWQIDARARERQRERERDRDRDRDIERERETETERQSQRQIERERERESCVYV